MAYLRKIKELSDTSVTATSIMAAFILGDKGIRPYIETNSYNINDKIIQVDASGKVTVLMAVRDNVTGPFNPVNWKEAVVQDLIGGGSGGDGSIELSEAKPRTDVKTWWQIRNTRKAEAFVADPISLQRGSQVKASSTQPSDPNIIVWLKTE